MRTDIKYKTLNVDGWYDIPEIGAYHVIFPSGVEIWVVDKIFHREDGPAYIWTDGTESYYLNGTGYQKSEYYKELYKIGLLSKKELFIVLL